MRKNFFLRTIISTSTAAYKDKKELEDAKDYILNVLQSIIAKPAKESKMKKQNIIKQSLKQKAKRNN